MNYPKSCKFIVMPEKGKVIAIMKYHGKDVRGISICSGADTFDEEIGKQLAYLRLKAKIAEKAVKFYEDRYNYTYDAFEEIQRWVIKEFTNLENCKYDLKWATDKLDAFERNL